MTITAKLKMQCLGFLFLCFFSPLTLAATEKQSDGGNCAINAAKCTSDLAKFNGKFAFLRFIKTSLHAVPNEAGTYQLTFSSVPASLHYICCETGKQKQYQKSISINDTIKLWQANAKQKLFIAQLWPLEKLSHFIFVVKKADYDAKNHAMTLTIRQGKDSAAIAPNFTDSLNTFSTFFLYDKEAYKNYSL